MKAGIRELKNRLSQYLRKVKQGKSIVITKRNVPIAKIIPIEEDKKELEDILILQESGLITWKGGKPEGLSKPFEIKSDILVSELIAEDRR